MVLRGRVTDARATNGRLERLVSTPGGAILMFSDAEGEPIERDQDFDLGSFEGLPEVGELARQGQVVLGFTLVQGRVQGVLLSEETVEIEEPGAFLPFKDLGKPTSGQESRPTLTATAAESLGGVAMLTGGERRLRLRGQGFSPRRRVSLRVDGVLQKGVVRTDAKGAFATVLVLNLGSLPHGAHEVEATQALGRQRVLSDRTHFLRRHQDPQPPRLAEP
jgi:hypothetical protein